MPVSVALAVKRDSRSRFGDAERVEDVVVVVGREVRVERDVDRCPAARPAEPMLVICRNGVGSGCVYGGGSTLIVPASSTISMRPSGRNFDARRQVEARREDLVLEGVRVGDVHRAPEPRRVELPAASRARAVSVCAPLATVRVSHGKRVRRVVSSGPAVDAVDVELDADDADVVGSRSR